MLSKIKVVHYVEKHCENLIKYYIKFITKNEDKKQELLLITPDHC